MVAGYIGLTKVATRDALKAPRSVGRTRRRIDAVSRAAGVPLLTSGYGSIVALQFQSSAHEEPRRAGNAAALAQARASGVAAARVYAARRGTINLSLETSRGGLRGLRERPRILPGRSWSSLRRVCRLIAMTRCDMEPAPMPTPIRTSPGAWTIDEIRMMPQHGFQRLLGPLRSASRRTRCTAIEIRPEHFQFGRRRPWRRAAVARE